MVVHDSHLSTRSISAPFFSCAWFGALFHVTHDTTFLAPVEPSEPSFEHHLPTAAVFRVLEVAMNFTAAFCAICIRRTTIYSEDG